MVPPSQSTELVPVDPPQKLIPIDEKPADIVERFFLQVVRPALNRRVRSLVMWEAFQQWCADREIEIAISHAMFGRLARWRKDRIGGSVWYLDCELAEGYADLASVRELKALPRLGYDGQRHADHALSGCRAPGFALIGEVRRSPGQN